MKKKISIITAGILIVSSINVYAAGANDLEYKQKENSNKIERKTQEKLNIETEKNTVNSEINGLISDMETLESEIIVLESKVSVTNNQIEEKSKNIKKIESEIIQSEEDIKNQELEIKKKNIELEENNEILNKRIRAAYKFNTFNNTIYTLLESESILDFAERLMVIERMAKEDREIIRKVEGLIGELDLKKENLNELLLSQKLSKEDLEKEKESLEQNKIELSKQTEKLNLKTKNLKNLESEKQQKVSELASEEKVVSNEILDIREENKALENEIQNLIQREQANAAAKKLSAEKAASTKPVADAKKPGNSSGGSQGSTGSNKPKPEIPSSSTPSSGYIKPVNGSVTSVYGPRAHPITGLNSFHTGIDISASQGTPVRATRGGVVIFASYHSGYGNHVIILHDNGLSSLYAHMSGFNTSVGSSISQGQTIGYVGSTGSSTGPHLHFEIRKNGYHINPNPYVGYY